MAISITATICAVGNILFGHFEEHTPKWRRVTKILVLLVIVGTLAATVGTGWALGLVGVMLSAALVIHCWWLPRHGINGWTGEPKEKYYELRGWNRKAVGAGSKES